MDILSVYILTLQLTLMINIMFPELIPTMFHYMIKQWSSQRSRWFDKSNRHPKEEHNSFWEIDMRKFK
jgi:hypothetical protein